MQAIFLYKAITLSFFIAILMEMIILLSIIIARDCKFFKQRLFEESIYKPMTVLDFMQSWLRSKGVQGRDGKPIRLTPSSDTDKICDITTIVGLKSLSVEFIINPEESYKVLREFLAEEKSGENPKITGTEAGEAVILKISLSGEEFCTRFIETVI